MKKEYLNGEIYREDGTTYFHGMNIKIKEPVEGMLFRASDGILYKYSKLNKNIRCACIEGGKTCKDITQEAFGENFDPYETNLNDNGWVIVSETNKETKMEEKRHIALEVIKVNNDRVTFKIAKQTHRRENFCKYGDHFEAKNGITLSSVSYPSSVWNDPYEIDLRGEDREFDNEEIVVSTYKFALICEAITEYNKTNGEGYEKLHPKDGEPYYYISSSGEIVKETYRHKSFDKKAYSFGNFFRTYKEAEKALENIKKMLGDKK